MNATTATSVLTAIDTDLTNVTSDDTTTQQQLSNTFMHFFFGCTFDVEPELTCGVVDLVMEAVLFVVFFAPVIFMFLVFLDKILQSRDPEDRLERKLRRDFLDSVRQVQTSIKGQCTHNNHRHSTATTAEDDDLEQTASLYRPLLMPFESSSSLPLLNCRDSEAVFQVQLQENANMSRVLDSKFEGVTNFTPLYESSTLCLQISPCSSGGWSLQGTRISETAVFKISQGHIAPPGPGCEECEAYWVETLKEADFTAAAAEEEVETNKHEQPKNRGVFQRERYPHEILVVGKFKETSSSNCFQGEWILSTCALRGRFNLFEPASTPSGKTSRTSNAQTV